MKVSDDMAMSALHMLAQGMDWDFIRMRLNLSHDNARSVSKYLHEKLESPTIAGAVGNAFYTKAWTPEGWGGAPGLSARRTKAVELISHGLTDSEAATELGLSARTIHQHVTGAMTVLRVKKRPHAVYKAFHWGILLP